MTGATGDVTDVQGDVTNVDGPIADAGGDVGTFEPAGDFEMPADMDPFDTGNPDFASPEMTEARAEANDAVEIGPEGSPVVADAFGCGVIAGNPVVSFEAGSLGDLGSLGDALGGGLGAAADAGFQVSNSTSTVLGFSFLSTVASDGNVYSYG